MVDSEDIIPTTQQEPRKQCPIFYRTKSRSSEHLANPTGGNDSQADISYLSGFTDTLNDQESYKHSGIVLTEFVTTVIGQRSAKILTYENIVKLLFSKAKKILDDQY